VQSSGCTRILYDIIWYIYIYIHRPNFGRTKRQRGCLLTYHKFGSNREKHIYIYKYIYIYIHNIVIYIYNRRMASNIMGVSENGDKAPSHGIWTAKWWYPRSCSQTPHFLSSPWKPPSLEEERPHTHTFMLTLALTLALTHTHTHKQTSKQTNRAGSFHRWLQSQALVIGSASAQRGTRRNQSPFWASQWIGREDLADLKETSSNYPNPGFL